MMLMGLLGQTGIISSVDSLFPWNIKAGEFENGVMVKKLPHESNPSRIFITQNLGFQNPFIEKEFQIILTNRLQWIQIPSCLKFIQTKNLKIIRFGVETF